MIWPKDESDYAIIIACLMFAFAIYFFLGERKQERGGGVEKFYPRPDIRRTTIQTKPDEFRSPRFGFHALPPVKKEVQIKPQILKKKDRLFTEDDGNHLS